MKIQQKIKQGHNFEIFDKTLNVIFTADAMCIFKKSTMHVLLSSYM